MSKGYRDAFPIEKDTSSGAIHRPGYHPSQAMGQPTWSLSGLSRDERLARLQSLLEGRVHGISFSPYIEDQSPGTIITAEQIRARMEILRPYTRWIRTFSCIEGHEQSPRIAHELGLKAMVGVGLGTDVEDNERELASGVEVARAGHADILAVGNEVLLRGDLSPDELIRYIERAREQAPGVDIGYVDAYFLFENHPEVAQACDVILINCYPFWERCPLEHSLPYMADMVGRTRAVVGDKRVIISETGWPTSGSPYGGAIPGEDNALEYFLQTYEWAHREGIEVFWFSGFDEAWKTGDEGDVGCHWGLWDADGNLKFT